LTVVVLPDTSLISLISRPFFYNVVKDRQGGVYAGTTEGVYRMEEATPVRVDDRKGYLMVDRQGGVAIDTNGVKFHQQTGMSHLLPFPEEQKNEYHAGNDGFFYITSGGRMHVYELRPFGYRLRNHSIRTVSKQFIGTYQGIYYRDRRLPRPVSSFSDGYIREYNGKVFMCTHGLDVFDLNALDSRPDKPETVPVAGGFNFIPCRDIRYLAPLREYLVASGNRVVRLDSSLQNASVLFTGTGNDEVVILHVDTLYHTATFSQANRLYMYDAVRKKVTPGMATPEPILDGDFRPQREYLLTANTLLRMQGGKFERKA
jgi:hypothetical protein